MPNEMRAYAERAMDSLALFTNGNGTDRPSTLITDLRGVMDSHTRILRDEETLRSGLEAVRDISDRTADLDLGGDLMGEDFELAVDLSYMLTIVEGILRGALRREESRGAHFRSDFPDTQDAWQRNLLYTQENTGLVLWSRDVAQPSSEIRSAIDDGHELDYHHLE
jgi:succinate dehydrogenase / fumarate reductase flavoprotein subunit